MSSSSQQDSKPTRMSGSSKQEPKSTGTLQPLNKQIEQLISNGYQVKTSPDGDEITVKFQGPPDTPYEGGVWNVVVSLPVSYPSKPPEIRFLNRIMHPNIGKGRVCFNLIHEHGWRPTYTLANIFEYFLPQLLLEPNPHDPLDTFAAELYMENRQQYEKVVKEYVNMFGTPQECNEYIDWDAD